MRCDPKIRCKDLEHTSIVDLKGGWSETHKLLPYKNGSKCVMSGEFSIQNNQVNIRGVIKKAKRRGKEQPLFYQFPNVKCFMGKRKYLSKFKWRSLSLSEDVVEVVDKIFL